MLDRFVDRDGAPRLIFFHRKSERRPHDPGINAASAGYARGVLVPGARFRALISLVLFATTAIAEPSRVALVRPAQPDPLIAEVTSRMNAELAASGFDVVIVPSSAEGDLRTAVELARTEPGVVATFAVVGLGKQAAVDVWLFDRITGKTIVKRLDPGSVPPGRGPAVLAIRAVELLRASLLETLVPPADPAAAAPGPMPADVSHFVETRSTEARPDRPWPAVWSFEAGVGGWDGFGGFGPSASLVLRLAYAVRRDTFLRATVGGPTLGSEIHTAAGSATTRQEFGLLELCYVFPVSPSAALLASAGGGVYHLQVQGSALPPIGAGSPQLWSATFDAGAGGALRIADRSALLLDVHALVTQKQASVTFADGETKRSGRPIAIVTLGLWAGF
jgi:hypothetical protein